MAARHQRTKSLPMPFNPMAQSSSLQHASALDPDTFYVVSWFPQKTVTVVIKIPFPHVVQLQVESAEEHREIDAHVCPSNTAGLQFRICSFIRPLARDYSLDTSTSYLWGQWGGTGAFDVYYPGEGVDVTLLGETERNLIYFACAVREWSPLATLKSSQAIHSVCDNRAALGS